MQTVATAQVEIFKKIENIPIRFIDILAHSPTDGLKSMSPTLGMSPASVGGGLLYPDVEMLEATHRGLHKFVPRHEDEIEVEIGDPIYVQKEADDLWSEGK